MIIVDAANALAVVVLCLWCIISYAAFLRAVYLNPKPWSFWSVVTFPFYLVFCPILIFIVVCAVYFGWMTLKRK